MLYVGDQTFLLRVSTFHIFSKDQTTVSESIVLAGAHSWSLITSLERSCIKRIKCFCQCYNVTKSQKSSKFRKGHILVTQDKYEIGFILYH